MLRRIYIHQQPEWPNFRWNSDTIVKELAEVRFKQGLLLGYMESIGFDLRQEAMLGALTEEVVKSSDIEGEVLASSQVRSSVARRLGMDVAGLVPSDRHVDGMVDMLLDATQSYDRPLTEERLLGWHAALFPTGYSGLTRIRAGEWRDEHSGPMQVVSGPMGRERVHFEAPSADRLAEEIEHFLDWFNSQPEIDQVVRAGLAHLWFVTIHPFEDGNGRIARAIADMALSRAEESPHRFYSMASQIRIERSEYYRILETTQRGTLDVSPWLEWFLACLGRAINGSEGILSAVVTRARFWGMHGHYPMNERQRKVLNLLLDGLEGELTSSRWARIARCSQDTALRDIAALIECGILARNPGGGRSTSYYFRKLRNSLFCV